MSINDDFIIIVGAGITGLTLAERFSSAINKKVIIVEKRNHIGGNCYDYYNKKGVLVSKYGPHVFHTNSNKVWKYINKFTKWEKYEHHVLSKVNGRLVPIPVNIKTINILFKKKISNETEMIDFLETQRDKKIKIPKNSKEVITSKLGEEIYELMFRGYTKKQWGILPEKLEPEVLARIPIRYNLDNRYNTDKYQYRPVGSFSKIFEKMINNPNIKLLLNTDYFNIYNSIPKKTITIFTGPIDDYVSFVLKKKCKLPYRSVKFIWKNYHKKYHQKTGVINYPNIKEKFVRSTEYKHLTGQRCKWTTVSQEYFQSKGEPCYPIPTATNKKKYLEIQSQTHKIKNLFFAGRLGKYKYINMDIAIEEALELFEDIKAYIK